MKIAMVCPYYAQATRGNAVTVRRIEKELKRAGCTVAIFPVEGPGTDVPSTTMEAFAPDVIHAFHGYLGGAAARRAAASLGVPYIVTLTGTDVYEALSDSRQAETLTALTGAARLIAFHETVKKRLAAVHSDFAVKTVVIPQGVEVTGAQGCEAGEDLAHAGSFTFFLPAGLRPVKNVLFPLPSLAALHREHPELRFILAGPKLDQEYAAEVLRQLNGYPFARYAGEIDHNDIGCFYLSCNVVLNTSIFEGGMANSVLEALAAGKAVLASDIEGNRSVVEAGKAGLLYRDEDEFYRQALRLILNAPLRRHLGENGRRFVLGHCTPGKEAAAYMKVYDAVRAS